MEAREELFERVERFLAGELSDEEKALFESEREENPFFDQEVKLHIQARKAIQAGGRQRLHQRFEQAYESWKTEEAESPPRRLWQRPTFWVSAAAAVAILFLFFVSNIFQGDQEKDLFVQYYESPSSDAARELIETNEESGLKGAIQLYQAGEYEKAIYQFYVLQADSSFAYTSMTLYYQGASYMELGQYDLAITKFKAVTHPLYYEQARWYRVLANLKLGNEAKAKELLGIIVKQKRHFRQKEAKEILLALEEE